MKLNLSFPEKKKPTQIRLADRKKHLFVVK